MTGGQATHRRILRPDLSRKMYMPCVCECMQLSLQAEALERVRRVAMEVKARIDQKRQASEFKCSMCRHGYPHIRLLISKTLMWLMTMGMPLLQSNRSPGYGTCMHA